MICPHCKLHFSPTEQLDRCPHGFSQGLRFDDQRRRGTCNVDRILVMQMSGNFFNEALGAIDIQGRRYEIRQIFGPRHLVLKEPVGQWINIPFIQVPDQLTVPAPAGQFLPDGQINRSDPSHEKLLRAAK